MRGKEWNCDIGGSGKAHSPESLPRHTDDRERNSFYAHGFTKHRRIATVRSLPESITEHGHRNRRAAVKIHVGGGEQSAKKWCHAQL